MSFASLPAILQEAAPLADRFVEHGHRVYLVGGIVRDLWLDRALDRNLDLDLTTDALPEQTKAVLEPIADSLWLQGERFGTIGAWVAGRAYEITTHRAESYVAHSRKPEVRYATAIEEDLSRRDFTVNAMAIELPGGVLIDPFAGVLDLHDGILRTPIDADLSFADDPLRMMRAARFVAGYDLVPTLDVGTAMQQLGPRLDIVSRERIREELDKLLVTARPATGLRLLRDTGLLDRFLPEAGRILEGRAAALEAAPARSDIRLALLLGGTDPDLVAGRLAGLRCSNERISYTKRVLTAAAAVGDEPVEPARYRAWHRAAGAVRADALTVAAAVDERNASVIAAMEACRARLGAELDDFALPLRGEDVIEVLGVSEGRMVGEALAYLDELRMAQGPLDEREARAALLEWWRNRN